MERLIERKASAAKSLLALKETIDLPFSKVVRDATIQRFEFTVESVWKFAQLYLRVNEGIDLASPKAVLRSCFQVKIISEQEAKLALEMIDDRNLTVHTYNEALAEKIYKQIPAYYKLLNKLASEIQEKI